MARATAAFILMLWACFTPTPSLAFEHEKFCGYMKEAADKLNMDAGQMDVRQRMPGGFSMVEPERRLDTTASRHSIPRMGIAISPRGDMPKHRVPGFPREDAPCRQSTPFPSISSRA